MFARTYLSKKIKYRLIARQKRRAISVERRQEAVNKAESILWPMLKQGALILSYASFGDELSTWSLNQQLAESGRLVLPRVTGNNLQLFKVNHLKEQLIVNRWGILEPNPNVCEEISVEQLAAALVPGLLFDSFRHRLGYGKGFYDRLLAQFPSTVETIGLGFREQEVLDPLPIHSGDRPLHKVLLF
jgi:5-formyltetrahydrofolate cyclo-ligase